MEGGACWKAKNKDGSYMERDLSLQGSLDQLALSLLGEGEIKSSFVSWQLWPLSDVLGPGCSSKHVEE